ncbi:hypothetical protein HU200_043123 [Digitaria exilis]|uniref:Reverse transcriptase zinc-binding domain-containing protein n=1 Tax=Digitaria exilis TaxID=1010633 RepID=A0A835BFD1_9POAL|nr:hypothetical protein HU200_043123 [Digitaria exilis]
MRTDASCPFCPDGEDCLHLFLSCPRAQSFWTHLQLDLTAVIDIEQMWIVNPFLESNQRIRTTVLTCTLWNLWKCRNAKVFRSEDESNLQVAARCHDDLLLWSNRCSTASDKSKLVEWSNFFIA